jgi:hypothetical protein
MLNLILGTPDFRSNNIFPLLDLGQHQFLNFISQNQDFTKLDKTFSFQIFNIINHYINLDYNIIYKIIINIFITREFCLLRFSVNRLIKPDDKKMIKNNNNNFIIRKIIINLKKFNFNNNI